MNENQIIEGIKDLRPSVSVSYKDFVIQLEPFITAIGGLSYVQGTKLANADLPYNSWYSDAFAALCTDEALKYTTITTASFDRACKCFGILSDLRHFIEFLFDLLDDVGLLLPHFYGFVSDDNARKLLYEENLWLLRFNNDKFLLTVAKKGNNGLELQDHEIQRKDGKYFFDGAEYVNLKSLLDKHDVNNACTGSPYMAASKMASKNNYNYYDLGDEISFRDTWSVITGEGVYANSSSFNVRLYNWLSIFNPNPALQQLTRDTLKNYIHQGDSTHVCRLLKLCSKSFALPDGLLIRALGRYNDIEPVVEYLYSIGEDPNKPPENRDPLLIIFANRTTPVRCLLKHPKIEVNIRDAYGYTPVMRSVDYPEALPLFLDDPRTDINARSNEGALLLDLVISRCPDIEMARKVIDCGFDLDKTSNKYLVQVLTYRKKLEDRIKGWKILVAAGVDINAVNEEFRTVLHSAVQEAGADEVKALLDLGANIDGGSKCPDTPLHLAAARGDVEITELLLARGADVGRVNKQGKKAEDLAAFATKRFFRKLPPPLGDFAFVGHRIEFEDQEHAIPARYSAELMVIGDHIYVQGGLYRKHYYHYEDGEYWNGAPFYDLWRVPMGNCLTDGKELLGKWERVALPPRDIYHHSYESIRTVNVGNEIWFQGFDDCWVKFDTTNDKWNKDPALLTKYFVEYLKTYKSYDMGDHILYPGSGSIHKISKKDGNIVSQGCRGEEFKGSWYNDHALVGDNIWLKRYNQSWTLELYCLNLSSATWYKVGAVDQDITGSIVAVGKYLLSTSFDQDTKEVKICVFDTESLTWTRHPIHIGGESGTLVLAEKQSMRVHKRRLILFGGQTGEETVTNAMYSIDLSPLLGVQSLAMISATAVVANQDKLSKEAIENLPADIKERMGFNDKR